MAWHGMAAAQHSGSAGGTMLHQRYGMYVYVDYTHTHWLKHPPPCLLTQSCELLGGVLALIVAILIGTKMQLTRPGMCRRTTQRRTHS
jgi:hypothetical protein